VNISLNEGALRELLESQRGPVFQEVERRADLATEALQQRINGIIDNPAITPNADFRMTQDGAIIGIVDLGRVSEYMDVKLGVRENWWEAVGRTAASQ